MGDLLCPECASPPKWKTVRGKSIGIVQRKFLVRLGRIACEAFTHPVFTYPVIVNIGIKFGCSMRCLKAGCQGAYLIGVDIDEGCFKHVAWADWLVCGNSNVVHAEVEPPIHLLFIDGSHTYTAAKADIEGWIPKIVPGGIVAFHDLHMPTVFRAFSEWREGDGKDWVEIDDPPPSMGLRAFRR